MSSPVFPNAASPNPPTFPNPNTASLLRSSSTPEQPGSSIPGGAALVALIALELLGAVLVVVGAASEVPVAIVLGVVVIALTSVGFGGFVVNPPNQSVVVTLLGKYKGTVRQTGWRWVFPITTRRRVSLKVRNFDSDVLKVNDAAGNPVEIAAVINWQVVDTGRAVFDVEDYERYVRIQTEAAIRHVASEYPYDNYDTDRPTLRENADVVMQTLASELQQKLEVAGVEVLDSRLRRLAYAPEIAQEMLRRQQAAAIVGARALIVEGAVGMVQSALEHLSERHIVELDEERKAAMVSNLLVVLCSDRGAQPVVNSGSLYQ